MLSATKYKKINTIMISLINTQILLMVMNLCGYEIMKALVRVKNTSKERVHIVALGDIKPNGIMEIPKKAWKLLHKSWPESRPYRCEQVKSLVEVDEKGNVVVPPKPKSRKPQKKPEAKLQSKGLFSRITNRGL